MTEITIRLATDSDVPDLRRLVNAAYGELADRGLNYTGTFQDEEVTRERMQGNDVYLAYLNEQLVGTISLEVRDDAPSPALYISQLGILPEYKRQGIGRQLLQLAETVARNKGITRLQLDTAVPATHLVNLYKSLGYNIKNEVQWRGKTYKSYVMEKKLD